MYKAEILADSLSPQGNRLITMKITFPRIIHSELMTHRMFSRNSASSRAIPFKKMVQMVEENPFIPIAWQENHKGMQGFNYLTDQLEIDLAISNWLEARNSALDLAINLNKQSNVTKQLCNRLLEPFMWHTVIVSATEWENFFALRCPQYECSFSKNLFRSKKEACQKDAYNEFSNFGEIDWLQCNKSQADIHIQAIAELMWDAYNESTPKKLEAGEWHIPFGDKFDYNKIDKLNEGIGEENEIKIATARCARISYETLGDNPKIDYEADLRLHDMLVKNGHASPLEHCALATNDCNWYANFKGFIQYRHLIENN